MDPIILSSFRGGLNNTDSPTELDNDQVVLCENVDWDEGPLGGRRAGHSGPLTLSGLNTAVVFLHRHLPSADETAAELWAISVNGASSVWEYKSTSWNVVTPSGNETFDTAAGKHRVRAVSRGGKLHIAYPTTGNTDRMHVWDGTSVRKSGLAEPASPTVANTGSGTYAATIRYYRVRYTQQVASVTVRRSEPSDVVSFTPSGSGTHARVTKPAAISEGETHWELEASKDNIDFYRIATTAVGTTTYDDNANPVTYATTGTLSEDVGDYSLLWNPKFVVAVDDRLMIAGAWENSAYKSRVGWTPVGTAPGVGNDERLEDDTDPFVDLDAGEGGEITDVSNPIQGYVYVFKYQRIYKMVRTGNRVQSYVPIMITDKTGALPGSVVMGTDEQGRPCVYYVDPFRGPSRIGAQGIQTCGEDIRETWSLINVNAALPCHGIFYPDKRQVRWYLAINSDTTPSIRVTLHTRYMRSTPDGARRGWSLATGAYQAALCSCLFAVNADAGVARSLVLKPFIGTAIPGALIVICDTGTTDNGTNFQAFARSRPFAPGAFVNKFGVRAGTLVASPSSGKSVAINLIRDLGRETATAVTADLTPTGAETLVVKSLDNLKLSDNLALSLQIGDAAAVDSSWSLDTLTLVTRQEERA